MPGPAARLPFESCPVGGTLAWFRCSGLGAYLLYMGKRANFLSLIWFCFSLKDILVPNAGLDHIVRQVKPFHGASLPSGDRPCPGVALPSSGAHTGRAFPLRPPPLTLSQPDRKLERAHLSHLLQPHIACILCLLGPHTGCILCRNALPLLLSWLANISSSGKPSRPNRATSVHTRNSPCTSPL